MAPLPIKSRLERVFSIEKDARMNARTTLVMINVSEDSQSVTAFKRNSKGMMKRVRKTGLPLVLTVKGKAEMVLLDSATYQNVAAQLDVIASIRRGLEQAKKGLGRPMDKVFDEIEAELDLR